MPIWESHEHSEADLRVLRLGTGLGPGFRRGRAGVGAILADNGIGLVYGGGSVGLMGELANAVLDRGGKVIGIIPTFLKNREHANPRGEVIVTRDMHERKQRMFDEADAFVALPGGVGTLEEVVEQMTWASLAATRSRSCSPTSRNSGTRCASCSTTWKSLSSSARNWRSTIWRRSGSRIFCRC
jgi:uncharacterized protein (TIGR00725 family)